MSPEKRKKLFEDFRHLFHPERPPSKTLMCFGFECGDGWYDIIYKLCQDITTVLERDAQQIEVLQVKEKYATLRFNIDAGTDEIGNLIDEAEEKSAITCEICGKEGSLHKRGYWLKTLCPDCAVGEEYEAAK